MSWQESQHDDELAHMREVIDLLRQAEQAGTPPEIIDLLAYECGVREQFNKECRR